MKAGWDSGAVASVRRVLGRSRAAWRRYPELRRRVRESRPGPPILVTGMYRSGTSWIGTMLAAPGIWHVHEPFHPRRGLWHKELPYPGDDDLAGIDVLVDRILRGRHRRALRMPHSHHWFLPVRLLPQRPRRVLIKDPSAALISEYLTRRHGMQTLVVFRHPCAVAASLVRLHWPTGRLVGGLLESKGLTRDWLGPMTGLMRDARGRRDVFSGAVLYACIARVLDGYLRRNPEGMRALVFEELSADPIARFRELYASLGLPHDREVIERHRRLCFPEVPVSGGPHGVRRRSADMAQGWKTELAPEDVATVRSVWEAAKIDRYAEPGCWMEPPEGEPEWDSR